MPPDILIVTLLRGLVEVAGFALAGLGLLALLAGRQRHDNAIYKVLQIVTAPAVRAVRFVTPRIILDAHIPMLAFFLLVWLWLCLAILKRHLCATQGLVC